jgi:hypothetical protein
MATNRGATRVLTRRDSCTQALKKLGVPREKYNDYILCLGPGEWQLTTPSGKELEKMRTPLADAEAVIDEVQKPKRHLNPVPAPKPPKPTKMTIAKRCLALFQEGKSNKDVLATIKAEYKLPDDGRHDHYPAWYRSYFRRNGKLPKKEKHS